MCLGNFSSTFVITAFRPNDLKRLRDSLIAEAERTRACIRIGSGVRPNKRPLFNEQINAQANNWLSIGQNQSQPFKNENDLKDIIELSRASAAICKFLGLKRMLITILSGCSTRNAGRS
jgi:hypothetical protein